MKQKLEITPPSQPPLRRFFALADKLALLVSVDRNHGHVPTVKVIATIPGSQFEVGTTMSGGTFVAVMNGSLGLYHHQPKSSIVEKYVTLALPEEVDPKEFGSIIGNVSALFLSGKAALRALRGRDDEVERLGYEQCTKDVLRAIGPNHPVFVISRDGADAFPSYYHPEIGLKRSASPVVPSALLSIGISEVAEIKPEPLPRDMNVMAAKNRREQKSLHELLMSLGKSPSVPKRQIPLDADSVRRLTEQPVDGKPAKIVKKSPRPCVIAKAPVAQPAIVQCSAENTGKRMFLETFCERPVKYVVDGKWATHNLPPGKYEVVEVESSLKDAPGTWYVLKDKLPEIVGTAKQYWEQWFNVNDPRRVIKRTFE